MDSRTSSGSELHEPPLPVLDDREQARLNETPRAYVLEVDSFDDEGVRGPEFAAWVQRLRTSLIDPIAKHLDRAGVVADPFDARRTTTGGHLVLGVWRAGKRTMGARAATDRGWATAMAELERGELQAVSLSVIDATSADLFAPEVAHLDVDLFRKQYPGVAHSIVVSFNERVAPSIAELQDTLVDRMLEGLAVTNGCGGRMTLDRIVDITAHEASVAIERLGGLRFAATHARGYDWGTVLGAAQLDALGGKDRVLSSAPVFRADDVSAEGRAAVYLQLTPDIREVSTDDLRRFRDFLRPILAPGLETFFYYGPTLRAVKDTDLDRGDQEPADPPPTRSPDDRGSRTQAASGGATPYRWPSQPHPLASADDAIELAREIVPAATVLTATRTRLGDAVAEAILTLSGKDPDLAVWDVLVRHTDRVPEREHLFLTAADGQAAFVQWEMPGDRKDAR